MLLYLGDKYKSSETSSKLGSNNKVYLIYKYYYHIYVYPKLNQDTKPPFSEPY